jgi:hypothetical protein
MLILLALVAVGALLYKCNLGSECITTNWHDYFTALVAAAVTNQATYKLSPQTDSVKAAGVTTVVAPVEPKPAEPKKE